MPSKKESKKENIQRLKRNEAKWTKVLMDAGWTVIPSVIFEKQHALGLDAVDVNIILQLAKHWWYRDNPPFPSKSSIADCMKIDRSTVRRHIAAMEKAGFIRRQSRYNGHGGRTTNSYHFEGLIKAATPFAKEALQTRAKRKNEDAIRRVSKKPLSAKTKEGSELGE